MKTRTTIVLAVLALAVAIVLGSATLGLGAAPTNPKDESKVPHYFGPYPNYANSPFTQAAATVAIAAPGGSGAPAEATATVGANGAVTGITITNPGSGYAAAPTVAISGAGSGATALAAVTGTGSVTAVTVTAAGSGYTKPTVVISGGGGTGATATAFGSVAAVTVAGTLSGYTVPTVDFDLPDDPNGVRAVGYVACVGDTPGTPPYCVPATAGGTVTIASVQVTAPGSGYAAAPGVAILDGTRFDPVPGGATGATATATMSISSVTVDTFGSGYTSAPTVTFNDPTGTGASATAAVDTGAVTGITLTAPGSGYLTPGGIKKFVDGLPGLCNPAETDPLAAVKPCPAGLTAKYIPLGVPDTTSYVTSDTYEIGLVQYRMSFSSSIPNGTLVRGYVQIETAANSTISRHFALYNELLDGSKSYIPCGATANCGTTQVYALTPPQYLGPTIAATKDKPVRIVFHNYLPTGMDGDLFLPVDSTIMGSGMGPLAGQTPPVNDGTVLDEVRNPMCTQEFMGGMPDACFTKNRATLHLHGGISPWISDGTPHQWITPAGESTSYPEGVSVESVPDMNVCKAGDDGCQTFYYTNQQSARLMFYHDHAWGITRLNVYAGEAAGYLISDNTEKKLISTNTIPGAADTIPLIIQDKTFVPNAAQLAAQDPTWDLGRWGGEGNLWVPHVYMPAQNPGDPSGMSAFGRWMYGPWFWPPSDAPYQPITNPYYDPACDPNTVAFCEPQLIPGTPNISVGMEAFNDTPIVNGMAYPKVTLDPKTYRLRILNAANDRFWNLQWYVADPTTANPVTGATEVALNPAELAAAQTDPVVFPTPDLSLSPAGPKWVQIGTEGGFLPAPVVVPNQVTTWITDATRFDVGNVDQHSLLLAPAERADAIVDFSKYAGKTLILYNDAPAAFPARVPSYDYYTGAPDLSPVGAPATLPGYGPNTRTIMQVTIAAAPPTPAAPFDLAKLNAAFRHHADGSGVFESGQNPIIVGQAPYNSAYGSNFVASGWCNAPGSAAPTKCDGYARIQEGSQPGDLFGFNGLKGAFAPGTGKLQIPFQPKGIHDEMNSTSFDEYGRMQATLGLEAPGATPLLQNIILYPFVNPQTEIIDATNLPVAPTGDVQVAAISKATDGTQIWKITHNGVDTHPIHFHLYDVQILNRVGWDNIILPPDATELGWKDTIRVSPLQDTYVALRPIIPSVPFELPNSIRTLNPMMPVNSTLGFSNVDAAGKPVTGANVIKNLLVNFGAEYVYHCHILSHEEMDMMRPVSVALPPAQPTGLAAPVGSGDTSLTLSWMDNSITETAFVVQRDAGTTWVDLATIPSPLDALNGKGPRSYVDTTYTENIANPPSYRVVALNAVGYGGAFMQTTVQSISAPVVAGGVGPAAPSNLTGILSAGGGGPNGLQVALTWTDNSVTPANATGFVIQRSIANANTFAQIGAVNAPVPPGTTFTDITVAPGASYDYRVAALNAAGMGAYSSVFTVTVLPAPNPPSALTATAQSGPQIALAWTDNSNNETGFTILRATNTAFTTGLTTFTVGANVSTYTDTPVVPGTTYSYRVRADNGIVGSAWSNTATVTFPAVPSTPAGLAASQLPGLQAALTWTDKAINENSYIVERSDNGSPFAVLPGASALPANAAAYTDTGLVPGHTYDYRVAAVNTISGPSAYSNIATLVVPTIPAAPTVPVGTVQAGPTVMLTWTNIATNTVGITLQRSMNGGAFTTLGVLASNLVAYVDVTVSPGDNFVYRLSAFNLSGASGWATSAIVAVPPAAPSGLARTITRTAAGPDTVALTWVDNALNETGFTLQRATNTAFTTGLVTFPLVANVATFTDTVTHGATYYYRTQAYNINGVSTWSNTITVTTVPRTPSGFKSPSHTSTSITLAWHDDSGNETGYQIQRRRVGLTTWSNVVTTAANAISYKNTGRTPATSYDYRIRGINGVGNSPWSGTIRVTTLP